MKKLLFTIIFFITLLTTLPTLATDYYFSDCMGGLQASGCIAGNNSNPGTAAQPKQNVSGTNFNNLVSGDRLLFARGGAWTNHSSIPMGDIIGDHITNPIVIDAYTPSWCTGVCTSSTKPILVFTGTALTWYRYTDNGIRSGFQISNLDLRGPGRLVNGTFGMHVTKNQSANPNATFATDINVNNVILSEFTMGVYCQFGARVKFTNSAFNHIGNTGFLSACSDLLLENNTFLNNGICPSETCGYPDNQRHAIYLGGGTTESGSLGWNVVVRGNSMTQTSYRLGKCDGTPIVVHYNPKNNIIENNLIYETSAGGGCWGIALMPLGNTEFMDHFIIRGNVFVGLGNRALSIQNSPDVIVENNVIINENAEAGGLQFQNTNGAIPSTRVKIRNNSFYFNSNAARAIVLPDEGSGHEVANNLIVFGSATTNPHSCFSLGSRTYADFTYFDRNLCYYTPGSGGFYSSAYATLALARVNCPSGPGNARFDCNGLSGNPNLISLPTSAPWAMNVQSDSIAINAGSDIYGSRLSIKGYPKLGIRDIGAYEFGRNP